MRIRTWGVQGIYEEGAVINLDTEAKKYKIVILVIQQTHIKETKRSKLENYAFFTSGGDTRRRGFSFTVCNELKEKINKLLFISGRICYIELG